MKKTYSLLFGLLIAFGTGAQSANQIIPKPNFISYPHVPTPFLIQASTLIYFDPAFANQATYLSEAILQQTGLSLINNLSNANFFLQKEKGIYLLMNNRLTNEKYTITIQSEKIVIESAGIRGIINGIQSLLQLIPMKKLEKISLEPVYIEDEPRFAYRGMHLDVVRHIFPVSYIKNTLTI